MVSEIDNSYSVTFLFRRPMFKQCVVWCGSKNKYKKDMCPKGIGQCAQSMIIILGSIVSIIWGNLYDFLMNTGLFTLMTSEIFI